MLQLFCILAYTLAHNILIIMNLKKNHTISDIALGRSFYLGLELHSKELIIELPLLYYPFVS